MIVLDASVLIAFLDANDPHHPRAEALLVREVAEDVAVNPLTRAEVLVAPTREGRLESALSVLADLEVQTLEFPVDAAVRLARLRAATQLRMPDCCVLLAVEEEGARLASFDTRLAKIAEQRGVVVLER